MGKEFSITPRDVPHVETKYRRIVTPLPHPDSVATLEKLRQFEPQSMRGQPPIVWDRAEDIFVYDKYGNRWLDWSQRRARDQRRPWRAGDSRRPSSTR